MAVDQRILDARKRQREFPNSVLPAQVELATLCGTPRQIKWATSIRNDAMGIKWQPGVREKLMQVTDATWWIANRLIVDTLKFKEPSPEQMAGCSVGRSTPAEPSTDEEVPPDEEEERPHSSSPVATPTMIPPRTEAAQKLHDLQDFEDRVSDAEKWAESVSHTPKLAEAAILAVLSRLYKDPMKTRLRGVAERKMAQAEAAIEKDKDAIRRMLQ